MMTLSNLVRGTAETLAFGSDFVPKCLWPLCGMILTSIAAEHLPVSERKCIKFSFYLASIFIIGV